MQLTDNQIIEFKKLYQKYFGKNLSDQEALGKGLRLINLVRIICDSETIRRLK